MLIQSSLPTSIEAALSFASYNGKQDLLCDWIPSAETWQKCPKCEHPQDGHKQSVSTREGKDNHDDSCSLIHTCSQLSTISTMSASSAPNCVYRRRNSVAVSSARAAMNTKESCDFLSTRSSEVPSQSGEKDYLGSQIELQSDRVRAPAMPTEICNRVFLGDGNASICGQLYPHKLDDVPCSPSNYIIGLEAVSKSESINGCSVREGHQSDEVLDKKVCETVQAYCSLNDSCSSSKSNVELGSASVKIEVDDSGEFSSSDFLALEVFRADLSEKDVCISILRSHGLVEGVCPIRTSASTELLGNSSDSNCSQPCKVCGHSEKTLNMLICDHCEEAFHVLCCNPRIKKIPIDEWFCQRCLKKKRKISLETTTGKSKNIRSEMCRKRTSKGELGPIAFMLKNTEPYTSGVRIGKAFQAEVPDWSGTISNDVDCFSEPLEMDQGECVSFHGWNSDKPSTPSTIGNWLQCQEVLYDNTGRGVDGTICGKWRRAPLFEVQTDDWECSCSVLWDPIHSDCAVPQELGTDEVLIHLKYIELLRPRLAAKKRKLSRTKSDGSE